MQDGEEFLWSVKFEENIPSQLMKPRLWFGAVAGIAPVICRCVVSNASQCDSQGMESIFPLPCGCWEVSENLKNSPEP